VPDDDSKSLANSTRISVWGRGLNILKFLLIDLRRNPDIVYRR